MEFILWIFILALALAALLIVIGTLSVHIWQETFTEKGMFIKKLGFVLILFVALMLVGFVTFESLQTSNPIRFALPLIFLIISIIAVLVYRKEN